MRSSAQEIMNQDIEQIERLAAAPPNYVMGAISGATTAWTIGFVIDAYRTKDWKRFLKYGAIGAGISVGFQLLAKKGLQGMTHWMHEHPEIKGVPVPATPVVTKGYFAGSPRPLHAAHDILDHRRAFAHHAGYAVGAPPPGGDYSFTRRPGYNGKDY